MEYVSNSEKRGNMKMDKWEEMKWAFKDIQTENSHYSRVMGLIKAGDALKEKAQKWDKFIESLTGVVDRDDLVNLEFGPE